MAKKPSRAQRKQIRERHERAQAHGLPGRALERPSKPTPSSDIDYRRRAESEPDDDSAAGDGSAAPAPSLLDKLKQLPLAVKLGALVIVVLTVIGVVASLRKH
jgi:hypothetical protein